MLEDTPQEYKEASENKVVSNIRLGLAIPFGILLIVFLIAGLYSFIGPTTTAQKKDFVQAVGVLVAGIAGVVGLFFTWRNLRLTRENTDRQLQVAREGLEQTQESTRETLRITERGQITDRFTRAIEQLGATNDSGEPKLELRLGGIFALERIARDSPEEDYSTVIEVLTAYVRENAPWPLRESANLTIVLQNGTEQQEDDNQVDPSYLQRPPADVKAIMDVLRRREEERVPEERRVPLDLRRTNLYKADLGGANLVGANLYKANLRRAYLVGANLYRTNLEGASLEEAYLQRTYLGAADLQGAYLVAANLRDAHFDGANLVGAYLGEANLEGAYLGGIYLGEANLGGAYLGGTDLEGASVTPEQLKLANGEVNTALPEGFQRPDSAPASRMDD